jgi:DNA-binding XRE family transcriptional regulator
MAPTPPHHLPATPPIPSELEHAVRRRLAESESDVYVRFRLDGATIGWEVMSQAETAAAAARPATATFSSWFQGVLRGDRISQEAAARRIGVSLKTVNRWVNGRTEPRLRELRRIREVFGAPPL